MIITTEQEIEMLWDFCGIKNYAELATYRPQDAAKLTGMLVREGAHNSALKDGYHDGSHKVLEEAYKLIPDLTAAEGRDQEIAKEALCKLFTEHAVKHAETTIEQLFERERIIRQQAANEEIKHKNTALI